MSIPRPTRPWTPSPIQRLTDLLVLIVSLIAAVAIVQLTALKGKLAYLLVFFLVYTAISTLYRGMKTGGAAAKNNIVQSLVTTAALIAITPILSILATVFTKGAKGISFGIFTRDMSLSTPTDPLTAGGLLHAITGTLTLVLCALILSVPIGILTALYLTEIRGRFTRPIRFLVQAMSGVPSIVAGLFILSAVLYPITKQYSGLMGSLALTILMIPTIARTSEEVLKLIPNDLREAGVALGGTQWRTVAMIVKIGRAHV